MSTTLLIITTYLVATLWEQYFHREFLHASSKVMKRWKGSEFVLYKMLYRGYYAHHIVHHKKTFTKAYTEQFGSKEEKERVDSFLIEKFGSSDDDQDYGLTINSFNSYFMFMFMFPLIVLSPILLYLLEMYEFVIVTVVMMLPLLLSKYIHPMLHGEIKDNWFYNNAYIKLRNRSKLKPNFRVPTRGYPYTILLRRGNPLWLPFGGYLYSNPNL